MDTLSYEEKLEYNKNKKLENYRKYHREYYRNNIKKEMVYCECCEKYLNKVSYKSYHLKSKKHLINLEKNNDNNNE